MHRYTAAESTIVYWGLGTYWGKIVPQNKKAHLIGHVRVRYLATFNADAAFMYACAAMVGTAHDSAVFTESSSVSMMLAP